MLAKFAICKDLKFIFYNEKFDWICLPIIFNFHHNNIKNCHFREDFFMIIEKGGPSSSSNIKKKKEKASSLLDHK